MELVLENQYLKVALTSLGAEPMSILHKESGREYLWEGNPAVWRRHSPMLFPNCGAVKNGSYIIEGGEYPAKQHGFARDMVHSVVCATKDVVAFRLENDNETIKIYPYKFALKTTYKLEKNILNCRVKIINYDDKPIYLSFGFHTGIKCPFVPDTGCGDYQLVFQKEEDCKLLHELPNGIMTRQVEQYRTESRTIPVTPGRFSGSMVLQGVQSEYIQLEEKKSGDYVRIHGTNSPYTVIWAAPDDVQLLCIEPWYGIGDYEDFGGQLEQKDGINKLKPMEEFVCTQRIEIGAGEKKQ